MKEVGKRMARLSREALVPSVWGRCQAEEGHRAGAAAALPRAPPREAGGHRPEKQCTGHTVWWDLEPRTASEWHRTEVLGECLRCPTLVLQNHLCGDRGARDREHSDPLQRGRTSLRLREELGYLLALWETAKARF